MNTKTAEEILAFRGLTISTRHSIEGSYNTIDAMEEYASPLKKRIEELEAEMREAVANYMSSEGCSCCRDVDGHEANKARIAKLLNVQPYSDGSGYDFSIYKNTATYGKNKD